MFLESPDWFVYSTRFDMPNLVFCSPAVQPVLGCCPMTWSWSLFGGRLHHQHSIFPRPASTPWAQRFLRPLALSPPQCPLALSSIQLLFSHIPIIYIQTVKWPVYITKSEVAGATHLESVHCLWAAAEESSILTCTFYQPILTRIII